MTRFEDDDKVIDITQIRKLKVVDEPDDSNNDSKLYDVVDMIVKLSIVLDGLGHSKYGNMLSVVVEKMFNDSELSPEDWGWEEESE